MIYNQILIRFGDLTLKGKNQRDFVKKELNLINKKLEGLNVNVIKAHERVYVDLLNEDYKEVIKRLDLVSGLSSYSLVLTSSFDMNEIKEKALALVKEEILNNNEKTTFKVMTRRADKRFPLESMEAGVVCITGNNHHYFNDSKLEDYLVVNNEEDVNEIAEKIKLAIKNEKKILKLYEEFSNKNTLDAKKMVINFLGK